MQCGSDDKPEIHYRPSPGDIIGIWVVDQDAMKKEVRWSPTGRITLKFIQETEIKITATHLTATLNIFGKTKDFTGPYKITSVSGNVIKIESAKPVQKNKAWDVVFLTRDQIRFTGLAGDTSEEKEKTTDIIMMRK